MTIPCPKCVEFAAQIKLAYQHAAFTVADRLEEAEEAHMAKAHTKERLT